MAEAVKKYSGMDYYAWGKRRAGAQGVQARGVHVEPCAVKGECLEACFDEFVEPNLNSADLHHRRSQKVFG